MMPSSRSSRGGSHDRREGLAIGRILQCGGHAHWRLASHKSFVRNVDDDHGSGDSGNFKGRALSNQTQEQSESTNAKIFQMKYIIILIRLNRRREMDFTSVRVLAQYRLGGEKSMEANT